MESRSKYTFRHNDGTEEHFDSEAELNEAVEKFKKAKRREDIRKHWFKFSVCYLLTFLVIVFVQIFLVPAHIVFCFAEDVWFTVKNLHDPDELLRNISNHGNL